MIAAKARREILDIVYSPEGVKMIKADCREASTQESALRPRGGPPAFKNTLSFQ
jgi:hypothetical protein